MPTTTEEIVAMKDVIDDYLEPEVGKELFEKLYENVGKRSCNMSVKLSLLMLKEVYQLDGLTTTEKCDKLEQIFLSYYNFPWYHWKRILIKLIC